LISAITGSRFGPSGPGIYGELGFDRLLFHPTVASIDQVDRLADAVL
jgi:hypothetical protein